MSQPPDRLSRSQLLILTAVESNQTALIDRIEAMLKPMQYKIEELGVRLEAMSSQLDQMHERQEQLERMITQAYVPVAAEDMTE